MENILDLPVAEKNELNYAGFGMRFIAVLIDYIVLQVVQIGLSYAILGGFSFGQESLVLTILSLVIGFSYTVAMQSSSTQATLGKMAVGIKVGDAEGNRISVANAIGRYFATFLSALILCIGYLMVIWDPRKQGLHDKLANTYVYHP